jgi:hypothetical protein
MSFRSAPRAAIRLGSLGLLNLILGGVGVPRASRRSPGVWNLNCTFRPEPTLAGGPRHRLRLTPMSDTFSKVEVITGIAERRRFSADLKLAVVG